MDLEHFINIIIIIIEGFSTNRGLLMDENENGGTWFLSQS